MCLLTVYKPTWPLAKSFLDKFVSLGKALKAEELQINSSHLRLTLRLWSQWNLTPGSPGGGREGPNLTAGLTADLTAGLVTQRETFLLDLAPTNLQLKARNLFYLLPHILLWWNSTWGCCIWCPGLKHKWYTKDMWPRFPGQILGPAEHIWEKLKVITATGEVSLIKVLNWAKIFVFMFVESLKVY